MFIFRYIIYQTSTKAYDKDFQVEVTEDNESYFIELLNSPDLHYWFYLTRSKWFLDIQDFIEWKYVLSNKTFNEKSKPYLIVCHRDENGVMNPDVMPRYFKYTRKPKILPNLFDLETFDHLNERMGREAYKKYPLFRNCLQLSPNPPQSTEPRSLSLVPHSHSTLSDNVLDFRPSRRYESLPLKSA